METPNGVIKPNISAKQMEELLCGQIIQDQYEIDKMIHYSKDCSIFEVKDVNKKDKKNEVKIVKVSENSNCIGNEI